MVSQSDLLPMMMPTRGPMQRQYALLALRQGIPELPVVAAQSLGLYDLDALIENASQKRQRLLLRNFVRAGKAAAKALRAERLRHPAGPHLHATVVDHDELQTVAVGL